MHLVLDIGNTKIKGHLFQKGICIASTALDSIDQLKNQYLKEERLLTHIVYADVRGIITRQQLQAIFPAQQVNNVKHLTFPFQSLYKTPATLGDDRIALVSAAVSKYSQQNCLIIDAGSCLTYDFITATGDYLGGAISPGLQMRFKSLQYFTGKLPLVEPKMPLALSGDSTKTAINHGVMQGIIYEIDGQISAYQKKYPSLTVILTGGDALHLSKSVKNTIFAEPNFLAEGLNYLLEYNKNEC